MTTKAKIVKKSTVSPLAIFSMKLVEAERLKGIKFTNALVSSEFYINLMVNIARNQFEEFKDMSDNGIINELNFQRKFTDIVIHGIKVSINELLIGDIIIFE